MASAFRLCIVLVLVILAGCGSPTRTPPPATPVPMTSDHGAPPATPTNDPGEPPDRIRELVGQPTQLAHAHDAALNDTSYTVSETLTVTSATGTLIRRSTTTMQMASDRKRFAIIRSATERNQSGREAIWTDGDRLYRTMTHNGNTTYTVVPRDGTDPAGSQLSSGDMITENVTEVVASFDLEVTDPLARNVPGESQTESGVTYYWVEGGELVSPDRLDPVIGRSRPRNGTFRAIVASTGVIYQYRLSYSTTVDGNHVTVTRTVRYTDIGNTRIDRPIWDANATTNTTGPDPLP